MLRKEGDGGRRPLLLGNNRQMLQEIRDSLRHLQKQNQNQGDNTGKPEPMQIKADLSQSTPNLVEKMGNGGKNMSRLGYNQKAMAEIRQSLANYQIVDEASAGLHHIVVPNGLDELTPVKGSLLRQLMAMGWDEEVASRALKISGNKSVDAALDTIQKLSHHEGKNGFAKVAASGLQSYSTKVIRKPSFEEKYRGQSSPVNSENSSVRSESPSMSMQRQYMEPPRLANTQPNLTVPTVNQPMAFPGDRQTPPPPLPPRGVPPAQTPPPPPLPPNAMSNEACSGAYQQHMLTPGHVQQMIRRMSPGQRDPNSRLQGAGMAYLSQPHTPGSSGPVTPQRGMSPVLGRQQYPHNAGLQNMTAALGLQLTEDAHGRPVVLTGSQMARIPLQYGYPPPYTQLLPNKSSPTLPVHEQSHMIVSQVQGNSSPLSSHSPSPGPMHSPGQPGPQMQIHVQPGQNHQLGSHSPGQGQLNSGPRPAAMQAWNAKQQPIIMQQVKSREVQKPVLQTATAPMSPPLQPQQSPQNYISSVQAQVNTPPSQQSVYPQQCMGYQQPFGNFQIEITRQSQSQGVQNYTNCNSGPQGPGRTIQIHINNHGPNSVQIQQSLGCGRELVHQPHWQRNYNIETPDTTPRSGSPVSRALNQSPMSVISTVSTPSTNSDIPDKPPPPYPGKITHQVQSYGMHDPNAFHHNMVYPHGDTQRIDETSGQVRGPADAPADSDQQSNLSEPVEEVEGKRLCSSPKPERKPEARKKDAERRETKVPVYSPQAFKFFMEQHVENLLKSHQQRMHRKNQLETEMAKVGLSEEAQTQMRKMLHQKESNYIRLKRAKMDKTMFGKIKTLGIGAFGEVALVHKKDTGHLYAMKTLCKNDVLQRNQAAHVKAERDILAEADNEWVVKLYYSFQDKDNLYFVMDYIPGGDMMSLLIKLGIFKESLAQFYIAELVLAIESVHKMGFIHRDIKPDNILIDRDGHIKLTDFGLCTGFRWTHNSKYYQKGNHMRQDSMEPDENWGGQSCHCSKELLKPLERRKLRHQRCLAHSLVGTPNYIAPEVLLRSGYTSCCDWWSVGVILYEMLVGQPPFLANTPAETQFKVINWESTLHFPQEVNLSPDATNLILRLCCGPEERLGHNGAVEIKKHPYFHDVPFDTLRRQPAPHAPRIRYPTDTSNFDPVDPDKLKTSASTDSLEEKRDGPYENGKHPDHAFFEFTFRRFFDDGGHAYATKLKDPETNAPVYV